MSGAALAEAWWWAGTLAIALAVAGLLRRDAGPIVVRAFVLLALGVAFWAAGDAVRETRRAVPERLAVVTTGDPEAAWLTELRAVVEAGGGSVAVFDGRSDPAAATVAARAAAPVVAVCWDGAFEPAPDGLSVPGVTAWTTRPPPPLPVDALELWPIGALVAHRPAALELAVAPHAAEATAAASGRVRVAVGPIGSEPQPLADLPLGALGDGTVRVPWLPEVAGAHRVVVEWSVDGAALQGHASGTLTVGPPRPPVLVLGPGAETVVRALAAQGAAAAASAELPERLAPSVVVATGALEAADAARLAEFVLDGGGLLLAGGAGGGALPEPESPLGRLAPLERLPDEPERGGRPGGGADPDAIAGPPAPEEEPRNDPSRPPEPPPPARTDASEGEPSTGDTSAARHSATEEAEVERRHVALVLVIDTSASMGDTVGGGLRTRLDLALRSAFETASRLEEGDELGVVTFHGSAFEAVPLAPLPPRAELERLLGRIRAGGSTSLSAGLKTAKAQVERSSVPIRHVVAITDGDLWSPDVRQALIFGNEIRTAGGTLSIVHVEPEGAIADVRRLAEEIGGGRYYRAGADEVPRLIFAEVREALGAAGRRPDAGDAEAGAEGAEENAAPDREPDEAEAAETGEPHDLPEPPDPEPEPEVEREPEAPDAARWIEVIALERAVLLEPWPDAGVFPPVRALPAVAARPNVRVLLAARDEAGTPLLAFANRGLGRLGAFASDLHGEGSERWRADPAFPARLAQWVEHLRPAEPAAYPADVLDERTLDPDAPTPAEIAVLSALAEGPVRPVGELRPPEPRIVTERRWLAADHAVWLLPALLALALVEWLARRRGHAAV